MGMSEAAKEARRRYKREWYAKNKKRVQEYNKQWRKQKLKEDPDYFTRLNREFWERQAKQSS